MKSLIAFGDRISFLFEKRKRGELRYDEVSMAKEKGILAQKILQRRQLCCLAGRIGA